VRERRAAAAALLAATTLLAAGCGGGGGGSLPEGASVAPREASAFVAVNTDFSSEQWREVTKLAARFPGTAQALAALEKQFRGLDFDRDVKPALGPEVDLVWLDFRNGGADVVGLTKPDTKAKLEALVTKSKTPGGSGLVTAQVGEWVAVADSRAKIDRFESLAAGDKLAGDKGFKDAMRKLDPDSSARVWVRGSTVQDLLDRALARAGAAPRITHEVGTLKSLAGFATAGDAGARVDADAVIDPEHHPTSYSPSLPDDVPAGAVLYLSFADLGAPTRIVLRMVSASLPNFETQLKQVEGVFGLTLEHDIYPLVKGEGGLAVYPGGRIPPILFLQKVSDEGKAEGLVRRFTAIAQLSGNVKTTTEEVAGVTLQKLTFPGDVTIWGGVTKRRLLVTNSVELARDAISGPDHSLADERLYGSVRDAVGLPDKVSAFAFGDGKTGLPFVFRLAEQSGSVVPPAARANTKPLQAALLYLRQEGDRVRVSGFVTIK
jgi:hypothetical protein